MIKTFRYPVMVFISFVIISCSTNNTKKFDTLKQLQGTWESTDNIVFFEQWEILNDSSMRGLGFSINNNDTLFSEQLYLQLMDNRITYIAIVWDQNEARPVVFPLVRSTASKFVFEKPEHDYPNRIIYNFLTDSTLKVRIETMNETKRQEFHLKRKK